MTRVGRPPKPLEQMERLGNSGKRPLRKVQMLPASVERAHLPVDATGDEMFEFVLDHGADAWIAPTDVVYVLAIQLWDDMRLTRTIWHETGDPVHFRVYSAMLDHLHRILGSLGLNPVDRSRLGVAVVRPSSASAVDRLRDRRRYLTRRSEAS